ncbi:MAG: response regulator transcription factor [Bacteroidia bacterium]|nr:response regulator transcription factor [Bacteroidia bacterium]
MIRVVIIDDHNLVREGLKKLLAAETDITVAGEAGEALAGLTVIESVAPDIVLLDVSLPGRSGLDILLDIRQRFPSVRVLMLSMHPEESYGVRALTAGASGYLGKDTVPEELAAAIRRIHGGRKYITPELAERLAEDLGKQEVSEAHERLSQREFEVMLHIASGKQPRDIAGILCIGERTVGTYRRRILEKLHLTSTADIIHYVLDHRLLT